MLPTFEASDAASIFAIGNSLTWDTRPALLDGEVQWHITCNKNLAYAFNHPDDVCLDSSTNWDVAFQNHDYDFVMMQPFNGTTLAKDAEVVSVIMDLEPHASIVIHTGWPSIDNLQQVYTSGLPSDLMRPSAAYLESLVQEIRDNHPGRAVQSDRVVDILYSIALDIDDGKAPFDSIQELYRDSTHLSENYGRYVAHNAARLAMNQPLSSDGFDLDGAALQYLDGKLLAAQADQWPSTENPLVTWNEDPIAVASVATIPTAVEERYSLSGSGIASTNGNTTLGVDGFPNVGGYSVPEPDFEWVAGISILAMLMLRNAR
jgi:hypothetical protein